MKQVNADTHRESPKLIVIELKNLETSKPIVIGNGKSIKVTCTNGSGVIALKKLCGEYLDEPEAYLSTGSEQSMSCTDDVQIDYRGPGAILSVEVM